MTTKAKPEAERPDIERFKQDVEAHGEYYTTGRHTPIGDLCAYALRLEKGIEILEKDVKMLRGLYGENFYHAYKSAKQCGCLFSEDDGEILEWCAFHAEYKKRIAALLQTRHTGECGMSMWESHGGAYTYNPNASCICPNEYAAREAVDAEKEGGGE